MKDWIPLFQSLIWPVFIAAVLYVFRNRFREILAAVKEQVQRGAGLSVGPHGVSLGEIKSQIEIQHEKIDKITENIDRLTNSTESSIGSLTSFILTSPLNNPIYKSYVDDRVKSRKMIIVGCSEYTEQRLLCAIISRLLREAAGFEEVIPKYNFGGAAKNFIALGRGEIDIYPVYTWTGFEMAFSSFLPLIASSLMPLQPADAISRLNQVFEQPPYPLSWVCHLGFNNNWELVMLREVAEKKGILKISALRDWNDKLTLGCEPEFFARTNGYGVLKNPEPIGYGIRFNGVRFYRHTDVYEALVNRQVDIIDGFTTDPQIDAPQFIRLKDDECRFGLYHAAVMARTELLENKEIGKLLNTLSGKIDASDMGRMIQEADRAEEGRGHIRIVEGIALDFLSRKHLLARTSNT